jgi:sugar lactone lactonase YvrE
MKSIIPLFWAAVLLGCLISVAEAQTLEIVAQPTNEAVLPGSTASFSVAVSGPGPLTYQWQFNGTNLPYGLISTLAGNRTPGYSGDGGAATSGELSGPFGVAVDASGNLFIADTDNSRIREVGTNGIITTVAGNGTPGYSGDGGAATNGELSYPYGVALDASGSLFVADLGNNGIRKVGTDGIITTVAGNGTFGYSGDGGAATNAALSGPSGVAVDAIGNLFIADWENFRIRKVGTNGIIATVAGNGIAGYSGDGGAATDAELDRPITFGPGAEFPPPPTGVAVDATGNLFIADLGNFRIRKVGTNGIITTVAGSRTPGYSGDGGAATNAALSGPSGVAVDASGNLFIADTGSNVIRKVVFPGPVLVLDNVGGANAGEYDVVVSSPYGSVTSSVVTLALAPLNALNVLPVGGQEVQVQFQGVPGTPYVLLSAADLTPPVDWRPVITNVAGPNGNWAFTDTNALSNHTRFYRTSTPGQ